MIKLRLKEVKELALDLTGARIPDQVSLTPPHVQSLHT